MIKKTLSKIGDKLTFIGESYNIRPLVYNPITWGRFFSNSRYNGRVFSKVVTREFKNCITTLDVGSGAGGYVYYLKKNGLKASGVEYSVVGRFLGLLQGLNIQKFDCQYNESYKGELFDLVYSIEVAEHIPDVLSDNLVEYITARGNLIIFSAAHPGQGGQGHINEQPKSYWIKKYEAHGFLYQEKLTALFCEMLNREGFRGWLPINGMIFKKKPKEI